MYIQGVENVYDLDFNGEGMTYGDVFLQNEQEQSAYNFEHSNTDILFQHFRDAETQCAHLLSLDKPPPLPLRTLHSGQSYL